MRKMRTKIVSKMGIVLFFLVGFLTILFFYNVSAQGGDVGGGIGIEITVTDNGNLGDGNSDSDDDMQENQNNDDSNSNDNNNRRSSNRRSSNRDDGDWVVYSVDIGEDLEEGFEEGPIVFQGKIVLGSTDDFKEIEPSDGKKNIGLMLMLNSLTLLMFVFLLVLSAGKVTKLE